MPARMASAAMAGMGVAHAAEMAAAAGAAGCRWWNADDADADGYGRWRWGARGMMGRGGASPHVVQNRPSVVPRTGVG